MYNMVYAPCVLRVTLDDIVMSTDFSIDEIDPHDIAGIEIYNGPSTIPSRFMALGSNGWCGLVAIWTRSD